MIHQPLVKFTHDISLNVVNLILIIMSCSSVKAYLSVSLNLPQRFLQMRKLKLITEFHSLLNAELLLMYLMHSLLLIYQPG